MCSFPLVKSTRVKSHPIRHQLLLFRLVKWIHTSFSPNGPFDKKGLLVVCLGKMRADLLDFFTFENRVSGSDHHPDEMSRVLGYRTVYVKNNLIRTVQDGWGKNVPYI